MRRSARLLAPLAAAAVVGPLTSALPAAASAPVTVKPALTGLISQSTPKAGYPISAMVVRVDWARTEPAEGSYDFSRVDSQVAVAAAHGWGVKLRIMAGIHAPEWVKELGGAPFPYQHADGRTVGTLGRFWSPAYGAAYQAFNEQLAARFDQNPAVREVTLSRCMTEFAEPLWREFARVPANAAGAYAAGYTKAADQACQRQQIVTDGAPWPHTHVDLALTGAMYLDAAGHAVGDPSAPLANLALLRSTWGSRGIAENNQLEGGKQTNRLYQNLVSGGGLTSYQVETYTKLQPAGVTGLLAALATGCGSQHAGSVELPTGYQAATADQLAPFATACGAPTTASGTAAAVAGVPGTDGHGFRAPAVWRPSTGTWYVQGEGSVSWGRPGDLPVAADYDGDGRTQLAVWRPSTGTWFVRGRDPVQWGRSGDIPVVGDYDGDGRSDLAVYRPSDGTWRIRGRQPVHYGRTGDVPVVGNFAGDDRDDLTVYRPSTGVWYVRGQQPVHFGGSGDVPMALRRHGSHDSRAVYRPSTGVWYVRRDGDYRWGRRGDVPVPAYYLNPAAETIAVFRPSTGRWWIRGGADHTWGRATDLPVAAPARAGLPAGS